MRVEEEEQSHNMEQDHSPRDHHRLGHAVTADHPAPCGWSWGGQNNCLAGLGSGSLLAGDCEQTVGGHRCWHNSYGGGVALQPPRREAWSHSGAPRTELLMWAHMAGVRSRKGQSHRSVSL